MNINCGLCPETLHNLADLNAHLRDAHGINEDFQRWPDGEPVVEDLTLTPQDFTDTRGGLA
jgi:hypothetical protein